MIISDTHQLKELVQSNYSSVVLVDQIEKGYIIKTYYHKYIIVSAYSQPRSIIIKVSRNYYNKNKSHLGLSLYSIKSMNEPADFIVDIPGAVFIGDPRFGVWRYSEQFRDKIWIFFRIYRRLSRITGLSELNITKSDFNSIKTKRIETFTQLKQVIGLFGTDGDLTKKLYPNFYSRKTYRNQPFLDQILSYFKYNKNIQARNN